MIDPAQSTPYVGRSLRRREDIKFLTGNGHYVDDIKLPGTLYLAILRSPHAHARITGVDLSAARAAVGVRLVLTGSCLISDFCSSGRGFAPHCLQTPPRDDALVLR